MSSKISTSYKEMSREVDKAVLAQQGGHWSDDKAENDRLWRTEARKRVSDVAASGDPQTGQLLAALSPATYEQQFVGIGHFVWAMAETGNFKRALAGACEAAGLLPPPEDLGPFDRLIDRTRAAREKKGPTLREAWTKLNTPRR